jgi:hypothetical protein
MYGLQMGSETGLWVQQGFEALGSRSFKVLHRSQQSIHPQAHEAESVRKDKTVLMKASSQALVRLNHPEYPKVFHICPT